MSVFKVKLQSIAQGYMDLNPATASPYQTTLYGNLGAEMNPSIQRTIYVTGPNHTYRKLKDGDQFTDSNYWKRFAYPQCALADAFIEVVTDDGSVYSDVASENTFPVVYDLSIANATTYTDDGNVADFLTDHGSFASFVQITNAGSTAVKVRINGSSTAIFDLSASETQVFNHGDLAISKLEFANTVSGGSTSAIQILASVKSVSNS